MEYVLMIFFTIITIALYIAFICKCVDVHKFNQTLSTIKNNTSYVFDEKVLVTEIHRK